MKIEKICEICSKIFYPKKQTTRFCSISCFNKRNKPTKHRERTCLNCGKIFLIKNMAYDKRAKVKYCSRDCNTEHNRKYIFNHNYFDVIDTNNKAYIIGLLWADGWNSNDSISISLQRTDENILTSILTELESNDNIKHITRTKEDREFYYSDIHINSRKMAKKLSSYGMIKAKTNYLKFPTMIPDEYIFDFIRGYFDGDGCMFVNKNNPKVANFSIYSNSPIFLQELYKIFTKHNIRSSLRGKIISITRASEINKIYSKFYIDSDCLCLDRKRNKFKIFLSTKFKIL